MEGSLVSRVVSPTQRLESLDRLPIRARRLHVHGGQARLHGFEKSAMGADAVEQGVQARAIDRGQRRPFLGAFATTAGFDRTAARLGSSHLPPSTWISSLPCSGKFGSLSSCAISEMRNGSMPFSIS